MYVPAVDPTWQLEVSPVRSGLRELLSILLQAEIPQHAVPRPPANHAHRQYRENKDRLRRSLFVAPAMDDRRLLAQRTHLISINAGLTTFLNQICLWLGIP